MISFPIINTPPPFNNNNSSENLPKKPKKNLIQVNRENVKPKRLFNDLN